MNAKRNATKKRTSLRTAFTLTDLQKILEEAQDMLKVFAIALGGALGALSRYGIAQLFTLRNAEPAQDPAFPHATLCANLLGCLLMGFLSVLFQHSSLVSEEAKALILVGFLGSLTTFSTFSNETHSLLRDGHITHAIANLAVSILLGLGAIWLGATLASSFTPTASEPPSAASPIDTSSNT